MSNIYYYFSGLESWIFQNFPIFCMFLLSLGLPNFTLLKDWLCFIKETSRTPDVPWHLAKNSEVKKPTYKVCYVIYWKNLTSAILHCWQ